MDEAARAEAWESYRSMSESYTLEGNDLHWLACALYVACRKSVPTVSKGTVEGNYVSLTRILRCSEQSLIEFFNKMKKWEDMANLPPHFRERTERLERNFTVSAVIFKKYEPIFQDIFKYPQEEQPRQQRGRKQRRQPCTVSEVFHFCWVLFIYAKGNFPMISDDLVNSYHLLLCALDLVYGNALQCSNRKELVNPNFKGLSEDFHAKDSKPSSDPPCVIEKLCSLHDGLVLEAKGIKEHFWKPYIRKLYEKKLLKGKEENLTGFLEPGNFGESFKAINKAYEEYVLSVGNLDERIFLGEDAEEEIGTLSRCLNTGSGAETAERVQMKNILQQHFDKSKALRVSTPLTGVRYIKDSSPCVTPVSTAIMRCYRTQPQARSQVYRSVLIKGKRRRRNSGSSDSRSHQNSPTELNKDRTSRDSSPVMRSSSTLPVPQPSSAPPTPTRLTGANSDVEEEERGDLIQFYNNIYIRQMKTFAMKYSQANAMDAPPLSPYPFVRTGSPRRIQLSQNHPVYISPHKNEAMLSPREKIFYYFSNSPSKRLREINSMIRTGETPTKKRGILLEDGSESPAKRICPENHSALLRRLQDVANDRGSH